MLSILQRRETGLFPPAKLYDVIKADKNFVQRLRLERRLEVHRGCVNTICWNESGTSILSGSDDQHLVISDPYTGKTRASIRSGHHSNIFCAKFLPSCQDQEIVSCSGAGSIYYTQVEREDMYGKCLFDCHTGTTYELVVIPNEARTFLTCGEDGTVRWYDLRVKTSCNKERCKEDVLINCRNAITSISVDPILPYQLATACADGSVRVFDRRMLGTRLSGTYSGRLMTGLVSRFMAPLENQAHRITSLNYSPFSHNVLVSYSAENVYLFNTQIQETKEFSKTDPEAETKSALNGDEASNSAVSDSASQPPTKRLRLRGDWSDTGPNARPERERTEDSEGLPQVNLMQRMSDMLTRWLDGTMRRRGDDPAGGRSASPAGSSQEGEDNPRATEGSPGTVPEGQEPLQGAQAREGGRVEVVGGEQGSPPTAEVWSSADRQGQVEVLGEGGGGVDDTRDLDAVLSVSGNYKPQTAGSSGFSHKQAEQTIAAGVGAPGDEEESGGEGGSGVQSSRPHQRETVTTGACGSSAGRSSAAPRVDTGSQPGGHTTQSSQSSPSAELCAGATPRPARREEGGKNSPSVTELERPVRTEWNQGSGANVPDHSDSPPSQPAAQRAPELSTLGMEPACSPPYPPSHPPATPVPRNESAANSVVAAVETNTHDSQGCGIAQRESQGSHAGTGSRDGSALGEIVEGGEGREGDGLTPLSQRDASAGGSVSVAVTTAAPQGSPGVSGQGSGSGAPATRLEPVISLHYSAEGTTASTIQVAYASFNVLDPHHGQPAGGQPPLQHSAAPPSPSQPVTGSVHPPTAASPAYTDCAPSLTSASGDMVRSAQALSSSLASPDSATLSSEASPAPRLPPHLLGSLASVAPVSQASGSPSLPAGVAPGTSSPSTLVAPESLLVGGTPDPSVCSVPGTGSPMPVASSSSTPEAVSVQGSAVGVGGTEEEPSRPPAHHSGHSSQEQSQLNDSEERASGYSGIGRCQPPPPPPPPPSSEGVTDTVTQEQPSRSSSSPVPQRVATASAGTSGARRRRVGHSGPPTGDFQLVLNEENEDDSDDEDDDVDREGAQSQAVPFWSYGASSSDERHYAAMCMQSMYRRRMEEREKQAMASVFQPQPLRMYTGHRNSRTMIKESNFWGDHVVMSGSDCGRIFLWDRDSTQLIMLLEADRHVVNCLQPHPFDPMLASSGIDYDVKIWTPSEPESNFDAEVAEEVMRRNQIMLEETRDTITVPAAFMLRVLASLNQIRAGRAAGAAAGGAGAAAGGAGAGGAGAGSTGAGRRQEESPGDSD